MEEEAINKAITTALVMAAELGVEDLKKQMEELGMNHTGNTANSLRVNEVSPTKVQIVGEQTFLTLVFGRKPGKRPPVDELKDWVESKGMDEGAEWGVAINIGKFGSQIFQGKSKGIDIDRTKQIMIDFFKVEAKAAIGSEVKDLLISLYR